MWKTIYEGNADDADQVINEFELTEHQTQGWISSETTPDNIKTYNLDGRINDCDFDHLLIVQEWTE